MDERLAFGFGMTNRAAQAPADAPAPATRPISAPPVTPRARPVRERSQWAFTGLLLFTALLYFRPQDAITPLAIIPLAEIAAVTALASMAYNRLSRGLPLSRVTPELIGVFALGGVILLTAPFSIWPGGAVATFLDMFVKVMLIFVLMVNTLTSPRRVERFTWVVVIAMSYIAFRAVFDYARGFNLIENGR